MGLLFFFARVVFVLCLYGMVYLIARIMWRGLPAVSTGAKRPRSIVLHLCRTVGQVVVNGESAAEGSDLELTLPVFFGRQSVNTVMIEDPFVSSCHAELMTDDAAIWLIDRGSTNGTWIGRRRVDRPVKVAPGGEFRMGGTVLRFEG